MVIVGLFAVLLATLVVAVLTGRLQFGVQVCWTCPECGCVYRGHGAVGHAADCPRIRDPFVKR